MLASLKLLLCVAFIFAIVFGFGKLQRNPRNKNGKIQRPRRSLGEILSGWKFLLHGRRMAEDANTNGILCMQMPWNRLHLVSDIAHYNDLNNAHTSQLSLHAAAKEVLQPKYTMQGFSWPDRRDVEGVVFVRCVRNVTRRLDSLIPIYSTFIEKELEAFFDRGTTKDGSSKVTLFTMTRRIATTLNNCFLFGEQIASDEMFNTYCDRYISQTFATAELINLLPSSLGSLIFTIINGRDLDRKYVWRRMTELIQFCVRERQAGAKGTTKDHEHMVAALVEACPKEWSVERILCEVNTVMVPPGAGVAVILAQAVQDLSLHPEFIPLLRKEILEHKLDTIADLDKHRLLEAFIMESARMNCFETGNGRRIALKPFKFTGGHQVLPGEWVSFNQQALLNSPKVFHDPTHFNPYRFLEGNANENIRLTDVSEEWPIWGVKKLPCPGRYQAEVSIKLTLISILKKWDFRLEDPRSLNMKWRLMNVPSPRTKLVARRRT